MKHLREGRHTRTPTNPIYPGAVTFGGVRGGQLGNSPFSRLPGWKPQSSNSEMLAGFLLLKLPVATMIYDSVSSPGGTAFPERWIKESRADLQKQATCKGSSKCLASPERTSRSIHFPKGRNRPLQLKVTKPWARRRQRQPQPETSSEVSKTCRRLALRNSPPSPESRNPQSLLPPPRRTPTHLPGARWGRLVC